jgi:negative regulator of flagellin synthesis FlgM
MIDPISSRRIATPGVTDARAPTTITRAPTEAARAVPETASSLTSEPRRMAAEGPPIDAARVDRLRSAIVDGSFVVEPDRIAAAMIAGERKS